MRMRCDVIALMAQLGTEIREAALLLQNHLGLKTIGTRTNMLTSLFAISDSGDCDNRDCRNQTLA